MSDPLGDSRVPAGPATTGPVPPTPAPPNGYYAWNSHILEDPDTVPIPLVGLSDLPVGDYIVWATITNGGGRDIVCEVGGPDRGDGKLGHIQPNPDDMVRVRDGQTVTVTGVIRGRADDTSERVWVNCFPLLSGGDDNPMAYATVVAMPFLNRVT